MVRWITSLAVVGALAAVGLNYRAHSALGGEPGTGSSTDSLGLAPILKKRGYRAIPLERRANSRHLWLAVRLAATDLRLVLDTGASQSVLDRSVADRLKLQLRGAKDTGALGGANLQTALTLWPTLEVGGTPLPLPYVSVVDFQHVNEAQKREGADRMDGLVGADVLRMYSAVIDYNAAALYLLDPARGFKSIQGEWKATEVVHNGKPEPPPTLRLNVDGVKARWSLGDAATEYRLLLDQHATPYEISFYAADGASYLGLYELTGGRLRMAIPMFAGDNRGVRARTLEPGKSQGFAVVTLERVAAK